VSLRRIPRSRNRYVSVVHDRILYIYQLTLSSSSPRILPEVAATTEDHSWIFGLTGSKVYSAIVAICQTGLINKEIRSRTVLNFNHKPV